MTRASSAARATAISEGCVVMPPAESRTIVGVLCCPSRAGPPHPNGKAEDNRLGFAMARDDGGFAARGLIDDCGQVRLGVLQLNLAHDSLAK